MKKLVIFLSLFCLTMSACYADCPKDWCCSAQSYSTSSSVSKFFQTATGLNFLSRNLAEAIIKSEIKKSTKEKFDVHMETYSTKDLLDGKFKALRISGKNLNFDGFHVTKMTANTLCENNYVEVKGDTVTFKENFLMNYNMEISNEDLRKTILSTTYLDALNKINMSALGITFLKLSSADVCINNNRLLFTINVTTPFSSKPRQIKVSADVKVADGKIVLTQMQMANRFKFLDLNKITYLINALNPLTFDFEELDKNAKIKIDSIDIANNTIYINGFIFIPKNTVQKG